MKSLPRIGPSERDDEIAQNLQGSKTRSDGALTYLVAEAEARGFWVGEGGGREATTSWAPMDSNKEKGEW